MRRMELHGTIEQNVISALRSAKRLRGQSVHRETVEHWEHVLARAEFDLSSRPSSEQRDLGGLVSELRMELASRERWLAR
jgi:hypothetical protein